MQARRVSAFSLALLSLFVCVPHLLLAATPQFTGGHIKYRLRMNSFPQESLFREVVGTPGVDQNTDLRLKFDWSGQALSLEADYQLIGLRGDSVRLADTPLGDLGNTYAVVSDERRLMDLTDVISQDERTVLVQRLDRLVLGLNTDRTVARLGRQSICCGNGLIYTTMDFFNPLDPAAVDTEYKSGDDMAYLQYLRDNGDDVQAVWVVRRDEEGEVSDEVDSLAAKYHGFAGSREYDLLLSEHYDDSVFAVGGLTDAGGALLRGDLVVTDTQTDTVASVVANLSYSWVSGGKNVSGILEYFYNGFGQPEGEYAPSQLASNPDLVERLQRGELFTIGRHYVAASAMVELTPLWLMTPAAFINADDGSALIQLVSSYDLMQDLQFLSALNVPVGPPGTEYGGIETSIPGKTLGTGPSLFLQFGYYF